MSVSIPPTPSSAAAYEWQQFVRTPRRLSQQDDPTWEIAAVFPRQGRWTAADYLAFHSNRMMELNEGWLEILPMPTRSHQLIAQTIYRLLFESVTGCGEVYLAPIPVYLSADKYREPDVVYCRPERIPKPDGYPEGADLVVEVVSDDEESRERDLVIKRREYAAAGITEYWIVDPSAKSVTVLTLDGTANANYRVYGEFGSGSTATSLLLSGLAVDVDVLFSSCQ